MKTKRNLIQPCFLIAALLSALTSEGATLVVTNTTDFSAGSLRQIIAGAAPGDTVIFATNLSGATLSIFGAGLSLNSSVTIDASALPGGIMVSGGNGVSRVFNVAASATVVLTALTITNGNDPTGNGGGGIYNAGTLTLNRCTLTGNVANNSTAGGGGIFNSGTLTLNQCTLFNNLSENDYGTGGGAIYSSGTLTVNQSTVYGNNADFSGGGGGGIYSSGSLTVYNSIVAGNSANGGSGGDIASFTATINFLGQNIVEDFNGSFSGVFPFNADPQLRPLGNYGGPTPTMPPLPSSPARFACQNSLNFTTDQRGVPRVNGEITDIGAVKLAQPFATTLAATTALNTNATLNATVNPNGQSTTAWFQWGVTNNPYSNQTAPVAVGSTDATLAFSNLLTTLTPGVVYHCRVVATNLDGTAQGSDVVFGSAPVVTLFGSASMTNECHTIFADPGATNAAGLPVVRTGIVNTNAPNVYQLTYTVTNSLGLSGHAIRLVTVQDTTAPVITMLGANPVTILTNSPYMDPGATALDACGGSFTVTTNGTVNTAVPGTNTITYSSTDSYGNTAMAMRTVVVRTHQVFVTTTNDSGSGSLRQVISDSFSSDIINFAANLSGTTILLTNGPLTLSSYLTIDASSLPGGIQINGNATSRIFNVMANAVVLAALTITNGKAPDCGGVYNSTGTLTLNSCTLSGNDADGSISGAGGLFNDSTATATLNQCTFTGNHADQSNLGGSSGAGGAIFNYGTLTVNQCTLTGNHADFSASAGGAICNFGALTVNQSTITGNHADHGTGFEISSGGILTADLALTNSIVAGNSAISNSTVADMACSGYATFAGANISEAFVMHSFVGPDPINADPQLAPLGNYGGPTQTMPPLPGSPAIDACTLDSGFATDQRGFPRLIGAYPDIGAVEGVYNTNGPGQLTGMTRLGSGSIWFTFTNFTDASFTALASTNLALPLNLWSNLGLVVESPIGSGHFQFTDPQATNYPQRFYRVRTP